MRTLITLLLLTVASTALAEPNFDGEFVGIATQVPTDLNGDGLLGRSFSVRILNTSGHADDQFIEAHGIIDSGLAQNPTGTCEPGSFELEVHGEIYWRTRGGDMVLARFRPQDPLCFTPGQLEYVTLDIVPDGRGIYEGATGTIDVTLNDKVRLGDPLTGLPYSVDTAGTFSMNLD